MFDLVVQKYNTCMYVLDYWIDLDWPQLIYKMGN